jgi:dephospho-CoA kinase
MKRIGLTGGIASGKSAVSMILRDLGIPVVDADEVNKDLAQKGGKVWQAIHAHFGSRYFQPDQELDRKALGDFIFSDKEAREALNRITHPIIRQEMEDILNRIEKKRISPLAVMDVPLLYESGWNHFMDETWVVYIPEELQIQRLMQRNGLNREQAELRVSSQMSLQEKCRLADRVIDNSLTVQHTRQQIVGILKDFETRRI